LSKGQGLELRYVAYPRSSSALIFTPPKAGNRPVSYYAFFKRWLLLSQLPGCLRKSTSFPT